MQALGPPLLPPADVPRRLLAAGWQAAWCRESAALGCWRNYAALCSVDYRKNQCLLSAEAAAVALRICPPAESGLRVEPHWGSDALAGALAVDAYASIRWAPVRRWVRDHAAFVRALRLAERLAEGPPVPGTPAAAAVGIAPSRWRSTRLALWGDQEDAAVRAALLAAAQVRAIEVRPGWLAAMSAAA